jgi:hypothetical protein
VPRHRRKRPFFIRSDGCRKPCRPQRSRGPPPHFTIAAQFRLRRSAVRQANACAVRVGLWAPLVPITEAPRIPRLGTSCAKPSRSGDKGVGSTSFMQVTPAGGKRVRTRLPSMDGLSATNAGALPNLGSDWPH